MRHIWLQLLAVASGSELLASVEVDGRTYSILKLSKVHSFDEALQACHDRNEKLIPIDISENVGTRIHLTKDGLYCTLT